MDETDINLPNQLKNFLNQFLRIMGTLIIVTYTFPSIIFIIIPLAIGKNTQKVLISSGTDEDRAKREPSLCNESVNGHFWSNMCLNCIFKWTWFVKTDIWSVIDGSRVRFPVEAALLFFLFFSLFLTSPLTEILKKILTCYYDKLETICAFTCPTNLYSQPHTNTHC